jgi:flagellin
MDSDAKGFEALTTSLSLSKATLGTARAAAERVVDQMNDLRERVIAANEPDAIRSAIDSEVQAIKASIKETINSAQVNGLNLLTGSDDGEFLISINRTSATSVTRSTFTVNNAHLLDGGTPVAAPTGGFNSLSTASVGVDELSVSIAAGAGSKGSVYLDVDVAIAAGATYSLDINGETFSYKAATGDDHNNVKYGLIAELNKSSSFTAAATAVDTTDVNHGIEITNNSGVAVSVFAQVAGATTATLDGFDAMSVSSEAAAQTALTDMEAWFNSVKQAAATLASFEMRIDMQEESLKALTDSLKTGAGGITDADMEAAAARLQALQVQQQLGIQALSIANQQPQTILSLFQ